MQTNITDQISHTYTPVKAMLIYLKGRSDVDDDYGTEEMYVESYDIGRNGRPVNAHPLSATECGRFAEMLRSQQRKGNSFLRCRGVLPENLLYLNMENEGFAIWHTPPMQRNLFFSEALGIPSGNARIPALLWQGSRDTLSVFALKGNRKPQSQTALYHAPFFNMYEDGKVCMGTVKRKIKADTCLEDFISLWENYFFNSYFSHTIAGGSIAGKNIVQLWGDQLTNGNRFPENELRKTGKTLADLLS
ncbi:PRTRC system protein B [Mucilaginibacter sp. P25]|uniref:PRTRC system protein B n=1 Tax=Mucilaginibacter sp. P25 TaxID=3423945 RepID=UPI003D7A9B53